MPRPRHRGPARQRSQTRAQSATHRCPGVQHRSVCLFLSTGPTSHLKMGPGATFQKAPKQLLKLDATAWFYRVPSLTRIAGSRVKFNFLKQNELLQRPLLHPHQRHPYLSKRPQAGVLFNGSTRARSFAMYLPPRPRGDARTHNERLRFPARRIPGDFPGPASLSEQVIYGCNSRRWRSPLNKICRQTR